MDVRGDREGRFRADLSFSSSSFSESQWAEQIRRAIREIRAARCHHSSPPSHAISASIKTPVVLQMRNLADSKSPTATRSSRPASFHSVCHHRRFNFIVVVCHTFEGKKRPPCPAECHQHRDVCHHRHCSSRQTPRSKTRVVVPVVQRQPPSFFLSFL